MIDCNAYEKEILGYLKCTHAVIKKMLDAGQQAEALHLLERCQGYGICLGRQIEKEELKAGRKTTEIISLLEDYCELVYQIYEEIRIFQNVDGDTVHNRLAKELIGIEKLLRNEK